MNNASSIPNVPLTQATPSQPTQLTRPARLASLDAFTTCAVAQRLGRRSVGIEQERIYFRIGARRLGLAQELDGEPLQSPDKTYLRQNGKRPASHA